MKTIILTLILLLASAASLQQNLYGNTQEQVATNSYCSGWIAGYKAGWVYNRPFAAAPAVIPSCPIPILGQQAHKDGYLDGFVKALQDRPKQ